MAWCMPMRTRTIREPRNVRVMGAGPRANVVRSGKPYTGGETVTIRLRIVRFSRTCTVQPCMHVDVARLHARWRAWLSEMRDTRHIRATVVSIQPRSSDVPLFHFCVFFFFFFISRHADHHRSATYTTSPPRPAPRCLTILWGVLKPMGVMSYGCMMRCNVRSVRGESSGTAPCPHLR